MTWEDVVAIGQRLPGVEAGTSYGTPALKVKGKFLTRLRLEDDSLVFTDVPLDERELLLAMEPDLFHITPHYQDYPAVLARLSRIDEATIFKFLERRWRSVAPAKLRAAFDSASKA